MAKTMWKRKRSPTEVSSSTQSLWQDLDRNILRKILELIVPEHLLRSVASVCRWWRSVCWEVLFWKTEETLDFTTVGELMYGEVCTCDYESRLLHGFRCAMSGYPIQDRHRDFRKIVFPPFTALTDVFIDYVSRRSPGIRSVVLPNPIHLTTSGLTKAVQNWRELEEMRIGVLRSTVFITTICTMRKSCKKLHTLFVTSNRHGYSFRLDQKSSLDIAENLPNLTTFGMDDVVIERNGVSTILVRCKKLKEIRFVCCRRMMEGSWVGSRSKLDVRIKKHHSASDVSPHIWCIDTMQGMYTVDEIVELLFQLLS